MSLVTLTTDLGYRDPYLAIVKARLLSSNPGISIIDLSCDIKDNAISDAAFIVKNALPHFPENTIHLVAVKFIASNSGLNSGATADNTRYLLSRYKEQYIVTPDNGLFTLIDPAYSENVYQLYYEGNESHRFFLKDVFATVTTHLLEQKNLEDIAMLTTDYYRALPFESFLDKGILRGKSVYVDDFGNIITNISREQWDRLVGKKNFALTLPGSRIQKISNTYDDVKIGEPLLLFNSFGLLELAVNGASAYKLLCKREVGQKFDFNLLIDIYD